MAEWLLPAGRYLAGPGSVVGGRRYEIARDAPIAELPGWLAALITRPAVPVGKATATSR